MDLDYDRNLEREIDQQLKDLGELAAPATLIGRVTAIIELRSRLPWYRRSWQHWPVGLQYAALTFLILFFAGLSLGGFALWRSEPASQALQHAGMWCSALKSIWNATGLLVNASGLLVRQLGTGLIAACLISAALLYAICVGLGSLCFRFATSHR